MVNIAAIKAAVDGAEKLTASQLEFAKDRIVMGTERKTMFISEDSKKVFISFTCKLNLMLQPPYQFVLNVLFILNLCLMIVCVLEVQSTRA